MKRLLGILLLALALALPATAAGSKLAGSYHSSLLDKDFYVFHKGGKVMVYVAGAKQVDRIQLVIDKGDIKHFNRELTKMERAFADYKDNPQMSGTKRLDASFPPVQVRWRDLKWRRVHKHFLVPYGTCMPDGQKVISIGGKLKSGKNAKSYCLSFASIEEVEEFKIVLEKARRGEEMSVPNR